MPVSRSARARPDRRANQKARTRAALVEAARALLHAGAPPTVAEAAERARVSRATAYRYFPTPDALLIEAGNITPASQPVEELVQNLEGDDPEARVLAVLERFIPIVFAEETSMRAALRTYQDTWLASRARGERSPPVREGRRMRWLEKALEPARERLSEAQLRRLRYALALVLSPDAMVVLKDVCRIQDDKEGLAVLRWAASALLRAGLSEAKAARRRR
ncbi:MAG TPA: helix-turn-helix domain-containing protein [Burkholderiales bacterium]|nr:helix-turn-helix domain-containing protein [Burkholderiales bacterium]